MKTLVTYENKAECAKALEELLRIRIWILAHLQRHPMEISLQKANIRVVVANGSELDQFIGRLAIQIETAPDSAPKLSWWCREIAWLRRFLWRK